MYAFLGNRGLDRLFTTNSKMFRLLGLNQLLEIMISNHPFKWTEDELFKEGERLPKGLAVVNDMTKRGMALIQDFNKIIEKEEDQLIKSSSNIDNSFQTVPRKSLS